MPNSTLSLTTPIGDGGEGTLELCWSTQILRRKWDSFISDRKFLLPAITKLFEMAAICGLEQIPKDKRIL